MSFLSTLYNTSVKSLFVGILISLPFLVIVANRTGQSELPSVSFPAITTTTQTIQIPQMTLDSVFSNNHTWISSLPQEKTITMIATGDVIPARSVNTRMINRGFTWPFEKTKDLLAAADLTIINLEAPLVSGCLPTDQGMIFCCDTRAVEGLVYAGVDIATLANNHTDNYSQSGIDETKEILSEKGITPVTQMVLKNIKGITFAFLAFNDIGIPDEGIKEKITAARAQADIVVVSFHWGVEYTTQPTDRQIRMAHEAVDVGADVILGNHPHWIQPVELYKDKFIIYAHGNFIFDQMWSEETKYGVVGRYTFYDGKLVDIEYIPVYIQDYGQPQILEGQQRETILQKMKDTSLRLLQIGF